MDTREQLQALLERVEKATGADLETDFAILQNLHHAGFGTITRYYDEIIGWDTVNILAGRTFAHPAPVTKSIDAALALVGKVLPEHDWVLGHTNGGLTIHCQLGPSEIHFGATPALSILAALLKALIAQEAVDA